MLTESDRQAQAELGLVPFDRLRALEHGLRARRDDARAAASADIDERAAAALRGKAVAYNEAAELVQMVLAGRGMRAARWSSARRAAIDFKARRAMRRDQSGSGS